MAEHYDFVRFPYRVQVVRLSSVAFYPKTKVNTYIVDGCERLTFLIINRVIKHKYGCVILDIIKFFISL